MKTLSGCFVAALCAASLTSATLRAADSAIVKGDNVNVRGQPSLVGEVVTQVKKGETVVVLEEITVKKPKTGEPAKWVKIQMPANTPVWANSGFVDTNNVVTPPKLNLRAGPGENYSVVGRVEKGQTLKPIRNVEGWIEVEGTTNAYAFVAADLLTYSKEATAATDTNEVAKVEAPKVEPPKVEPPKEEEEEKPAAAKEEEKKPAEPKKEMAAAPPVPPPLDEDKVAEEPKVAPTVDIAPPAPVAKPKENPAPAAPLNPPPAAALPAITPPPVGAPVPQVEEPAPIRIVTREGIVKSLVSIQAPTYFELRSAETHKLLNYLHPVSTNIVLKKLSGKKVIVTGEEEMDVRWPSTPVIKVQKLEIAP